MFMLENTDQVTMNDLLTPIELSRMLSVPMSTVYYWTHIEYIPHIKIGRHVRFDRETILKWLSEREVKTRNVKDISSNLLHHRIRKKAYQPQLRDGQVISVNRS